MSCMTILFSFSFFFFFQISHQATSKMGCHPGDCKHMYTLIFLGSEGISGLTYLLNNPRVNLCLFTKEFCKGKSAAFHF